jgi:hypothetical protein
MTIPLFRERTVVITFEGGYAAYFIPHLLSERITGQ